MTKMQPRPRAVRYIARNPNQEIAASYNTSPFGDKEACAYAMANARRHGGKVIKEYADESQEVVKDFSWID